MELKKKEKEKKWAQLGSSDQIICINKYVNSSSKLWNKKSSQSAQQTPS